MKRSRKFNLIDKKELKRQSKTLKHIEDNKPVEIIKSKRSTYFNTLEVILIMILTIISLIVPMIKIRNIKPVKIIKAKE